MWFENFIETIAMIFFQFNPMEQLMSVFPAASKQHLPEPWSTLMDDSVCIIQFDFVINDIQLLNDRRGS